MDVREGPAGNLVSRPGPRNRGGARVSLVSSCPRGTLQLTLSVPSSSDWARGARRPRLEGFLGSLGRDLLRIGAAVPWDAGSYRPAGGSEELVYEVARASDAGPALYLVSDGPGVSSPPHEHLTWAVIVGLGGVEVNVLYELVDARQRRVRSVAQTLVAPGDTLVLVAGAIHSTHVEGGAPTYHLHLYGKPLDSLPAFASRRFERVGIGVQSITVKTARTFLSA